MITKQVIHLILIMLVGTDICVWMVFVWEETVHYQIFWVVATLIGHINVATTQKIWNFTYNWKVMYSKPAI